MSAPRIMIVSPQKTGTHLMLELVVALGYRVFGAIRSTPRSAPDFTDAQRREIARLVLSEDGHADLLRLTDQADFRRRTDRAWSALAWGWQQRLGQPVVNRYGQDLHDSVRRTATNPDFPGTRFAETPEGLCWIWHELDPSVVDGSFIEEWSESGEPRIILNIRDPRDALLSLVNFVDGRTAQGIGNFYERRIYNRVLSTFDTLEEKIDYALRDQYFLASREFEKSLWLLHHPDVCVVRYEELAGPAAGGSRQAQLAAVRRVIRHIDEDGDPAQYSDDIYNPDAWSFHRGVVGGWREQFSARNLSGTSTNDTVMSLSSSATPESKAFLLLGGFGVVCRNPRYVRELAARGLAVLLLTPESWRAEIEARPAADPIVSALHEVRYVRGDMKREGSFTSGALAAAMDWRGRYDLAGLFAVGEVLVEPAGLIADALGLPSPGLRATRACRSKVLQRWYLPDWSPHSVVVPAAERDRLDLAGLRLPVVVKPAGRHSSSGVRTHRDLDGARAAVAGYPAGETVLVEERVAGQEFSVESLVQSGQVLFDSVTRKETTESAAATFVELRHTLPAAEPALLDAARGVLRALDFRDGIAHSEWRLDPAGRPVLMEIAARTPGDGLLALYELATGLPLEPEILRAALGEPAGYRAPRRFARQVYLEHPPGILRDVTVDWPGVAPLWIGEAAGWPEFEPAAAVAPAALRAVLVLANRGAELRPLTESDDRAVTFLLDAPSEAELDELEERVRAAITIRVDPAGGAA